MERKLCSLHPPALAGRQSGKEWPLARVSVLVYGSRPLVEASHIPWHGKSPLLMACDVQPLRCGPRQLAHSKHFQYSAGDLTCCWQGSYSASPKPGGPSPPSSCRWTHSDQHVWPAHHLASVGWSDVLSCNAIAAHGRAGEPERSGSTISSSPHLRDEAAVVPLRTLAFESQSGAWACPRLTPNT